MFSGLIETRFMRILFLQNIWFEFLGTMSLLGVARQAGYAAGLAIGKDRHLLNSVAKFRPEIVAFSCVTGTQGWALNLCRRIKTEIDPGIITLMGGPHPTFFPEIIENYPYLDMICVGEGEGALLDILGAGNNPEAFTQFDNLHVRIQDTVVKNPPRPLIQDLDALPFLEREQLYQYRLIHDNPVKRMITGRGCPHSCTFCFNHSAMKLYRKKGKYVRKRSIENVMEEIRVLKSKYPVETIRFEDDLFGVSREWLLEFCDTYPRHFRIPYICSLRADAVDREIAAALKNSGCFNIVMGVESGDETVRNGLLKKNISDAQLIETAALFREFGLNFCTTNILGLPGETFRQALKTVTFTTKLQPTFTWCAVFQPYPRTELGQLVIEKGLVEKLDVDDIDPNYHSGSLLKQPDIHRCVNLHKFFYVLFNHPGMLPLVKLLSHLPPNPLYTLIHRVSFLFIYSRRWNISLWRAVREAFKTAGFTKKISLKKQET